MSTKRPRSRAPNLGDERVDAIAHLLDGWDGKLTWDLLIEAIAARQNAKYTRQALDHHDRITEAFRLAKERLSGQPRQLRDPSRGLGPVEAEALLDRYRLLEAENTRLSAENSRLLEKFVTWAYHASTRGLDEAFLSQPLPTVNREQTKLKVVKARRT